MVFDAIFGVTLPEHRQFGVCLACIFQDGWPSRQPPRIGAGRNTRYQADAAPYLDRSSTGWIAPTCLAHLFDHHKEQLRPAIFSPENDKLRIGNQNSLAEASRAPSLRVRSFDQTTSGATRPHPAEVSKPQSFAASTAEASPITATIRSSRTERKRSTRRRGD
jgi:hypothetical protein